MNQAVLLLLKMAPEGLDVLFWPCSGWAIKPASDMTFRAIACSDLAHKTATHKRLAAGCFSTGGGIQGPPATFIVEARAEMGDLRAIRPRAFILVPISLVSDGVCETLTWADSRVTSQPVTVQRGERLTVSKEQIETLFQIPEEKKSYVSRNHFSVSSYAPQEDDDDATADSSEGPACSRQGVEGVMITSLATNEMGVRRGLEGAQRSGEAWRSLVLLSRGQSVALYPGDHLCVLQPPKGDEGTCPPLTFMLLPAPFVPAATAERAVPPTAHASTTAATVKGFSVAAGASVHAHEHEEPQEDDDDVQCGSPPPANKAGGGGHGGQFFTAGGTTKRAPVSPASPADDADDGPPSSSARWPSLLPFKRLRAMATSHWRSS